MSMIEPPWPYAYVAAARESRQRPRTLVLKVSSHCSSVSGLRFLWEEIGVLGQDLEASERLDRLFDHGFNLRTLRPIGNEWE